MTGQVVNGTEKGEMSYFLKVQSRYNGSGREWHGKVRKGIQSENAKQA